MSQDTIALGESALGLLERVIVANAAGVFEPHPPETVTAEGEIVTTGQSVGTIRSLGEAVEVTSRFTGFLMEMIVSAGQRVRPGQPIAWLRVVGEA